MKYLFTFLVLFVFNYVNYAQIIPEHNTEKCGSDIVHKWRLEHESGYAESYAKLQSYVNKFVAAHPDGFSPKAVITIPVVFHIVLSPTEHAGFLDSRCTENIGTLNTDFAGLSTHSMGDFPASLKANCDIQFCLATISPTGAATTGIERVDYNGPEWTAGDNGVKQSSGGGLDAWDPTSYLNIWVCNLTGSLLGYGTYPTVLDNFYGLVIDFTATGTTGALPPFDLGGTASHEIGHCFYLEHIWGDLGACSVDDGINDTPIQESSTSGNPTPPLLDACQTASPGIMFMNYMDYSDDIAYANFTPDQKTIIQALFASGGILEPLTNSIKCGIPLVADFIGNPSVPATVNIGGTVDFTDLTTGTPTAWEWTFTGAVTTTSSTQNPQNIQYSTLGLFPVKLKVTKPNFADSITKLAYIEVINPLDVNCDFIGAPTCIVAGDSVNFTDLSTNTPTTWKWKFNGGTPDTAIVKNPQNILYDTPGVYSVYLHASNLTSSDTLTKLGYITVMDPSEVPNANFMANLTNMQAGTSINFTNQSTGLYDSLQWYFSGAVPPSSTSNNPASITYNTVGDFNVTLILYSSTCNNDTLIKPLWIHVFDPADVGPVHADFHATTSRLIYVPGATVNYEDLSTGNITQWQWTFYGGTPPTSPAQSPQSIGYTIPNIYDVCLIVSNSLYSDTLCKTEYIVVSDNPWPNNSFCDTVTNILPTEHPLTFMHLTPKYWGYFPGHNGSLTKYYAEKVTNYTFSEVSGLIIPPVKCYSASPNNKVIFTIWDVDNQGLPGSVLGTKNVLINTFVPLIYKSVMFDTPVQVNGQFFVGYQLYYNTPYDTFVVYMSPNRPNPIDNHLYLKKNASSVWQTPTQFFQDTMQVNVSLAISVIGCLVGINVEEINMDSQISVYPNPTSDKINIELKDFVPSSFNCNLYDLTGRKIKIETFNTNTNFYEIDVSKFNNGIYLLEINVNNQRTVKKVSIIK
ncbi:MAG: hypothetical protein A2X08_17025 [Bacteroidetes bacterium GWA2_32_17]|nr:MAG: hypothetical protein A2X08_17025 [Bacteroidetes bacterium GWA2_32_17]